MATKKKASRGATAPAGRGPRFTLPVNARLDEPTRRWLDDMITASGMREADVVRRIIDDARRSGWTPAASLAAAAESANRR